MQLSVAAAMRAIDMTAYAGKDVPMKTIKTQNPNEQNRTPQGRQNPRRLPMTSDLVFRTVLGRDAPECKRALIAVLNLILDRKGDPIVDLEYKNPFHLSAYIAGKRTVMDIKVSTSSNETMGIEMQVEKLRFYANRSVLYANQLSSEGLESGEGYDKIKKAVHISIVSGNMDAGSDKYHGVYRYREVSDNTELSDLVELHYLKLDRLPKVPLEEMSPLERFGYYIAHSGKENRQREIDALVRMGEEAIALTDAVLRKASQEEILKQEEWARKMWELDQVVQTRAIRNEGLEEGRKEGHEEGLKWGIQSLIDTYRELGVPRDEAKPKILKKIGLELDGDMAEKYLERYWPR